MRWERMPQRDAYRDTWGVYPPVSALEYVEAHDAPLYKIDGPERDSLDEILTAHAARRGTLTDHGKLDELWEALHR